jgi:5-amino-6-(5-phospho-D-ribitylamino)uracil phosphatase
MNPYFIALDLDGSLLNKAGELSALTIKVINRLKELGHTLVIATGRPFSGAIGKYTELRFGYCFSH